MWPWSAPATKSNPKISPYLVISRIFILVFCKSLAFTRRKLFSSKIISTRLLPRLALISIPNILPIITLYKAMRDKSVGKIAYPVIRNTVPMTSVSIILFYVSDYLNFSKLHIVVKVKYKPCQQTVILRTWLRRLKC